MLSGVPNTHCKVDLGKSWGAVFEGCWHGCCYGDPEKQPMGFMGAGATGSSEQSTMQTPMAEGEPPDVDAARPQIVTSRAGLPGQGWCTA